MLILRGWTKISLTDSHNLGPQNWTTALKRASIFQNVNTFLF